MQVACILLPLCFVYDIFWVFIEPLIMGGTSVMVEVRTPMAAVCYKHVFLERLLPVQGMSHNVKLDMYSLGQRISFSQVPSALA